MPAQDQGQLCLPKTDYAGRFLLLITVDPQVDAGGQPIQILGDPAMRIKCLGISEVIHQLGEPGGHFIRIVCMLILIILPLINIFFNKETFSHRKNLALYLTGRKYQQTIIFIGLFAAPINISSKLE